MRAVAVGLCVLVGCLLACGVGDLDGDIAEVRARTLLPGATLVATSPVSRDPWGVGTAWEVETGMRWEEYVERMRSRLPGFADTGKGAFIRTLAGDVQTVRVEPVSTGAIRRFRITFTATAR